MRERRNEPLSTLGSQRSALKETIEKDARIFEVKWLKEDQR